MTPNLAFPFQGNCLGEHKNALGSIRGALKEDTQASIPLSHPLQKSLLLPKGPPACFGVGLTAWQTYPHVLVHKTSSAHRQKGSSKDTRVSPTTETLPHHQRKEMLGSLQHPNFTHSRDAPVPYQKERVGRFLVACCSSRLREPPGESV